MDHQDWEPKILYKRRARPKPKATPKPASSDVPKKKKKISRELRVAIMQARSALKMKQKDLARACNVPLTTIQSYENGTGTPQQSIIHKIERALRTKFPVYK